jgi:hypothetical protein
LAQNLPPAASQHISTKTIATTGTAQISHLAPAVQHDILQSFVSSFHDMFLLGIPFALAAFAVSLFLRETPLRTSAQGVAEGSGLETGAPKEAVS